MVMTILFKPESIILIPGKSTVSSVQQKTHEELEVKGKRRRWF